MSGIALLTIFVLAIFVGFEVVSKVSSVLHTPLMSGANAIHGVILVGAIIILGTSHSVGQTILGFLGVILGMLNALGGFLVTYRMLEMFKSKRPAGAGVTSPTASSNGQGVAR